MRATSTRRRCMRCGKQLPDDSDDYRYWEFLTCDADDIICPRCREEEWRICIGARPHKPYSRLRPWRQSTFTVIPPGLHRRQKK
jgi:DNA-directed RNA polymerase subunit RPC12/RpoP